MEPVALRNWNRRDDSDHDDHPELINSCFMTLHVGDTIWPLRGSDPQPTERSDGQPWQYGQNITTARHGWYPSSFVRRPPEHFIHESQRTPQGNQPEQVQANQEANQEEGQSLVANQTQDDTVSEPASSTVSIYSALCGYCGITRHRYRYCRGCLSSAETSDSEGSGYWPEDAVRNQNLSAGGNPQQD